MDIDLTDIIITIRTILSLITLLTRQLKWFFINYDNQHVGRIPAITYYHKSSEAVLTRSAQPMIGLGQKKCPEDDLLLNLYRVNGIKSELRYI